MFCSLQCAFKAVIRIFTILTVLQTGQAFATAGEQEIPYSEIRELSYSKFNQLFQEYADKNNLRNPYSFFFGKTCDVVHFLEQFVNLEELQCGLFPFTCTVDVNEFTNNPPRLPNLKSLTLQFAFASHDLDWIASYPSLETLTIYNGKEINAAPLQKMEHLSELNLVWAESNSKLLQANCLPPSLKSLFLYDYYVDASELNHLKLKKLWLSSKHITNLPEKAALAELESLDLSGSSIRDLSSIEGNLSLKSFAYSEPVRDGVKADFSILSTLPNLEGLYLAEFPQKNADLRNAIKGLSKLQRFGLSGKKLSDLSSMEGLNLHQLAIEGRLLSLVPDSVLSNPCLKELKTTELELADSSFSWSRLSPNLQYLDLGHSDFCDFSELSRFPLVMLNCENVDYVKNEEELVAFAPTLESLTCKGSTIYRPVITYRGNALEPFKKLKYLNIDFSDDKNFTSLSFLKQLPSLEELEMELNDEIPPEAFDVFLEMKNLKKISTNGESDEVYKKIQELSEKGVPID